jgi:hypothetical protein
MISAVIAAAIGQTALGEEGKFFMSAMEMAFKGGGRLGRQWAEISSACNTSQHRPVWGAEDNRFGLCKQERFFACK